MTAPDGYEWKYVKLPRHDYVSCTHWKACMFVSAAAHDVTLAVLVEKGVKGVVQPPRKVYNESCAPQ
jgi:hypothetical protein